MVHIRSLVVKVAELCNLNCSYCYLYQHEDHGYRSRPKFMSDDVFEHLLRRVRQHCDDEPPHTVSLTFHGGEPLLVGVRTLSRFVARATEVLGPRLARIALQTNATLITDEWVQAFRESGIQVGVSLDGPQPTHDDARVDHLGRGSHRAAIAGLKRLQDGDLDPGVLCVINPRRPGLETYQHFRDLGVSRISFLLPDVSHDNKARFYGGLAPTPIADYLQPIFDAWWAADDPKLRIRPFRGLLSMMVGGEADGDDFGNPVMDYLVVETDGSIEALDALRVCEDGMARSGLSVITSGFEDLHHAVPRVYQLLTEGSPLADVCRVCPERDICGGGYLPHRYSRASGFSNPSVWCRDILALLAHIRMRTGLENVVSSAQR